MIPIDNDIVNQVETLAISQKQPLMKKGMSLFEWTTGYEIIDINETNQNDDDEYNEDEYL